MSHVHFLTTTSQPQVWNPSDVAPSSNETLSERVDPPSNETLREWMNDPRVITTLIVEEENDRQNRFKPRSREIIPTACVYSSDDGVYLTHEDLEMAYDVWKVVPDVCVPCMLLHTDNICV